jgi:CDP-4-dehydro-6-deoxyglucose reductase
MSYSVKLHPGGETFDAGADEPVLAAALRAGLNLPHSCRGGSCLSCRARIVAGRVAYPGGEPPALDEADKAAGNVLLCQAAAKSDLVVEARTIEVPGNVRIRRLPCRVQNRELLTPDVMGLHLRLPGFEPFEFLAGQYVDILLTGGGRRSFSIASPPHDAGLIELHVRRVPGGRFTEHVFGSMKERALLRLEGPLGQFFLREDAGRPIIMVAGGTGYAPIKAMLRHAFHLGIGVHIEFFWGVRKPTDLYDLPLISSWRRPGFEFTAVISEPDDDAAWDGRTGYVHEAVLEDHPDLSAFDVYAAGPPVMVEALREGFGAAGLPPERLFFDSFDYAHQGGESG